MLSFLFILLTAPSSNFETVTHNLYLPQANWPFPSVSIHMTQLKGIVLLTCIKISFIKITGCLSVAKFVAKIRYGSPLQKSFLEVQEGFQLRWKRVN